MPLQIAELDRRVLEDSPLTNVICQIRFDRTATVAEAKTARAFHDALGGSSGAFPKLNAINEQSVNVALGPNIAPSFAQHAHATGWRLSNDDETRSITLLPSSVALEAQNYAGWDADFRPILDDILSAVDDCVSPVFEERIGLRYINQIVDPQVTRAQEWREHLDPHLLGLVLHDEIGEHLTFARQQAVLELENEVRCTINHGFGPDPDRPGRLTYLLDVDVARSGMRPYVRAEIVASAAQFNSYALRIFQLAITPTLLERFSAA